MEREETDIIDRDLLIQVLCGEKSPTDFEFTRWLENDDNKMLYLFLKDDLGSNRLVDRDKIFENISETLDLKLEYKLHRTRTYKLLGIVATIAVILISGMYLLSKDHLPKAETSLLSETTAETISISTEDGEVVELSPNVKEYKLDELILKSDSVGTLTYEVSERQKTTSYHLLNVPRGKDFKLLLQDGSRVHLNSESKLRYPTSFNNSSRFVELEGEAYFEVAKNTAPFIVKTASLEIEVLGTTFNVKAYANAKSIDATLVEGKIQVSTENSATPTILLPGYNLNYNHQTQETSTSQVNLNLYTSWIKGRIVFHNENLEDIMATITRWYNLEVEYKNENLKKLRFTGSVEKNNTIDYMINQIERITKIKFKKEDEKLIIYN